MTPRFVSEVWWFDEIFISIFFFSAEYNRNYKCMVLHYSVFLLRLQKYPTVQNETLFFILNILKNMF